MSDREKVHIDWSYADQGRNAYERGEKCEPPEKLHMIAAMSWAGGWLDAAEEDPEYTNPHEPTDTIR